MIMMKKVISFLFCVLVLFSSSAAIGSAATFYCDNDADSTTYTCNNISSQAGWAHNPGHTGDWHNDSRLADGTIVSSYAWDWDNVEILTDRRPSIYVWLANPNFTNTRTAYWVGHYYPSTMMLLGYLNQNTAISGWNSLGRPSDEVYANYFGLHVDAYDNNGNTNTQTGADYIRFEENTSLLLNNLTALYPSDPGIKEIQQLMLNSIDNFSDASGSFNIKFSNNHQDQIVEFNVKQNDSPMSYEKIIDISGSITEHSFNGKDIVSLHHRDKLYSRTPVSIATEKVTPLHLKSETGESLVITRKDPAWAYTANEILHPQNYAFWLTETQNKIVGHEVLLDRKAVVIQGEHEDYLANKLGAKLFAMWVDVETGILLKLEGTGDESEVVYSITVNSLQIDQGINELLINRDIPTDWTEITG